MEQVIQILILIFSGVSIFMLSRKDIKYHLWGHVIGLAGQPLWVVTSYQNDQFGIQVLCIVFIYSYISGIRNCYAKRRT